MNAVKAYEEVIDFIAAGTNPGSVIAFRPSETANENVNWGRTKLSALYYMDSSDAYLRKYLKLQRHLFTFGGHYWLFKTEVARRVDLRVANGTVNGSWCPHPGCRDGIGQVTALKLSALGPTPGNGETPKS